LNQIGNAVNDKSPLFLKTFLHFPLTINVAFVVFVHHFRFIAALKNRILFAQELGNLLLRVKSSQTRGTHTKT